MSRLGESIITDATTITAACDSCGEFERSGKGEAGIGEVLAHVQAHAALGHSVSALIDEPEPPEPWDSWPAWLKRDGTGGVPHYRPRDGAECPYLGLILCAKCGWVDGDSERVQRARELLEDARQVMTRNSRGCR